ncbi:hypothetical protein [Candidatus Parabeggiatoa sp. HSG14]|uniref:InlB B-repeat-containing protein n=1 Tax=Candidatus Parabeggiatoa sp. HSG14 TaxID=3055593 RepID=UPI0025A88941|nr:hypothetical protein [Thiotrichales bacterium HSG14]
MKNQSDLFLWRIWLVKALVVATLGLSAVNVPAATDCSAVTEIPQIECEGLTDSLATDECIINLDDNTHTCQNVTAINFVSQPSNHQVVTKITLEPSSKYVKAIFEVTYGSEPTDWTVNIGDSQSNNGWAGDNADQSNDAEMQIKDKTLAVFGNDYIPSEETTDGTRHILSVPEFTQVKEVVRFEVSDGYLAWLSANITDELYSPYLYALNGQADNEGSSNYDIYAAFNRVISSSSRSGSGVSFVCIKLTSDNEDTGCTNVQPKDNNNLNVTVTEDPPPATCQNPVTENKFNQTLPGIEGEFNNIWWNEIGMEAFAVSNEGRIVHLEMLTLSEMDSGTNNDLFGIWGNSNNKLFAVGNNGTIIYYNGTDWTSQQSNTLEHLYGIWGNSATDVFAVGLNGAIIHYDGSQWNVSQSNTNQDLFGIWGSSATDVFAIGSQGTIIHYDGNQWAKMVSGTDNDLFGIWGISNNDIYVVTRDYNTIIHYDGIEWKEMESDLSTDLFSAFKNPPSDSMSSDDSDCKNLKEDNPELPVIEPEPIVPVVEPEPITTPEPIVVVPEPVIITDDHATPSTIITQKLTITLEGNGKVTSTPDGIDCGTDCSKDYSNGTAVTVTAIPEEDSRFTGWGGQCSGIGSTDSFTVTMNTKMNCSAIFTPIPNYTFTINKIGSGSGTVTDASNNIQCGSICKTTFYEGDSINLITTPDDNSRFVKWAGSDCADSLTITKNMKCMAVFNKLPSSVSKPDLLPPPDLPLKYTLKIITMGSGKGIVQSKPIGIHCGKNCKEDYASNTHVTLTAKPETGSRFSSWHGDCERTVPSTTVTMTENLQCKALFELIPNRILTVNQEGSGTGMISASKGLNSSILNCTSTCNEDYTDGSTITLTAIAETDSLFTGWIGNKNCADSITITENMDCTATFELLPPPDDLEENDLKLEEKRENFYGEEIKVVTFEDKTVKLPILDEVETVAVNTEGEVVNTDAEFVGGISVEGEAFEEKAQPKSSDKIDVRSSIEVDSEHLGETAEVLVVAAYQPEVQTRSSKEAPIYYYMLDDDGNVLPWDVDLASLIPFKTVKTLDKMVEIPIYQGVLGITGTINLYVGYRLANGTVIYSPDSLDINITE